ILACPFFLSSSRRHTRSKRDWSSDVCSSDLSRGWCRPAGGAVADRGVDVAVVLAMRVLLGREQLVDAGDVLASALLQLGEHRGGGAEGAGGATGEGLPAVTAPGEQAGPLEHHDVLLHRREAHRVVPGQGRDRLLASQHPPQDVPPRAIRERMEPGVRPVVVDPLHDENLQPFGCACKGWLRTALRASRAARPRSPRLAGLVASVALVLGGSRPPSASTPSAGPSGPTAPSRSPRSRSASPPPPRVPRGRAVQVAGLTSAGGLP